MGLWFVFGDFRGLVGVGLDFIIIRHGLFKRDFGADCRHSY